MLIASGSDIARSVFVESPLRLMPFLASPTGGIDAGKALLTFTLLAILLSFMQFVLAKLFWSASPKQALKVAAISVLGMLCAATPLTIFLTPLALVGSHIWVARRRGLA